ncbi:MAG: hypothetical protein QM740_20290 [Acidovorax sp.]
MKTEQDSVFATAMDWVFLRIRPGRLPTPLPAEFAAWLEEKPEHFQAYLDAARLWRLTGMLQPGLVIPSDDDMLECLAREPATGIRND